MIRAQIGWLLLATLALHGAVAGRAAEPAAKPADDAQAALEKKFAEDMSGVVLVGHFTNGELKKDRLPKEEKYTIEKVSKLIGDTWLFQVQIEYGDHNVKLPLPLEVKWAGDTPVVTLNKTPVPGLGTFSSRVLFYDNHYAGTWDGGDHGGHLFGKIVKKADSADTAKPAEKQPQK